MIEYINKRLIDWAAWVKRRDDGGLGYAGEVAFMRLAGAHSAQCGPIVTDAAAMEIEGIYIGLKRRNPKLHQVAYWFYLAGNLTRGRAAKELGCSETTAYVWLHQLHQDVMDQLHEISLRAEQKAGESNPSRLACKTGLFM